MGGISRRSFQVYFAIIGLYTDSNLLAILIFFMIFCESTYHVRPGFFLRVCVNVMLVARRAMLCRLLSNHLLTLYLWILVSAIRPRKTYPDLSGVSLLS